MKKLSYISITVLISLFFGACDKEIVITEEPTQEITWDWSQYELSDTLQLGNFSLPIQPKQSLEINSNNAGILTLYTTELTSLVENDFLWAEMDKEKLAEEELRINIAERKRKLEKHKIETIERPEQKKAAHDELKKAQSRLAVMKRLRNSKQLHKRTAELLDGDVKDLSDKAVREQENEVELAIARINTLTEIDEILWSDADTVAQMDLEQTLRQHKEATEASIYQTPFAGELRIELDLLPDTTEYTVTGRQLIATLNDYSEIHASLDVKNVSWINLHPSSLTVTLSDINKTEMAYSTDKLIKDGRSNKASKHYIFSIPLEGNESLKRLAGTNMDSQLSTKLAQECYIVPKLDISLYALNKTAKKEYTAIVPDLWEGATVLAEGANHIAIAYNPKDDLQ